MGTPQTPPGAAPWTRWPRPSETRRLLRLLVLGSLVVELLLAEGWLRLARGSGVLDLLLRAPNPGTSLAAGAALAVVLAVISRTFFSTFATDITRNLFVPIFGCAAPVDVALLAVLPGLGEEVLFRGTIQPEIGLLATSLGFGLLHSGFSRPLLPYGAWAAGVGVLLGSLYLATGNLWAPVAAHALTNAAGVLWVRRLAAKSDGPDSSDPSDVPAQPQ